MSENPYLPKPAVVESIYVETEDVRTIEVKLKDFQVDFKPGQFAQILVPGVGEAPFCIASSTRRKDRLAFSIQRRGNVTIALHQVKIGDVLGIRAPLGNGFPLEDLRSRDVVIIATGMGIAAAKPLILYILENRGEFGDVTVLYGARYPWNLIYRDEYDKWREKLNLIVTLSRPPPEWKGARGRVTAHFSRIPNMRESKFIVCGAPKVIESIVTELVGGYGVKPWNIYVSLERHMKCGIGRCARCLICGGKYVCLDGPVFNAAEIPMETLRRDRWIWSV